MADPIQTAEAASATMDIIKAAVASGLITGGGISAAAAFFLKRHLKKMDELDKFMIEIRVELGTIKLRIGDYMAQRQQIIENTRHIAIAQENIKGNKEDIDKGFAATRRAINELKKGA